MISKIFDSRVGCVIKQKVLLFAVCGQHTLCINLSMRQQAYCCIAAISMFSIIFYWFIRRSSVNYGSVSRDFPFLMCQGIGQPCYISFFFFLDTKDDLM